MLAVALASAQTDQGSMYDCSVSAACQPWGVAYHACQRKSRMDLRITLDRSKSRWSDENSGTGESVNAPGAPYFFCPVVDELQAFSLNHSAYEALTLKGTEGDSVPTWDLSASTPEEKYLNVSIYGMGYPDVEPHTEDDASALVVEKNSTLCPPLTVGYNASTPGSWPQYQSAMVQLLILNLTMTKGEYKYSSKLDQPIQSGFAPTCDETDNCKLFNDGVCIGLKKGKKNCAKCISSPSQVSDHSNNIDLKIWASYYGTDKTGRKMMSGSENPLAFTQFSAEPVFEKVGGELGNIERKF